MTALWFNTWSVILIAHSIKYLLVYKHTHKGIAKQGQVNMVYLLIIIMTKLLVLHIS